MAFSFGGRAEAQLPSRSVRAARLVERAARLEAAGHVPGALGTYREAVQVDPGHAPAYVGLVRLYLGRGEVPSALEAARVGRRRRPEDVSLGLAEVDALVAAGRTEEALEASRALTLAAPRSLQVWTAEGALTRRHGRFARALTAYRRIVRLADEGVAVPPEARDEARQLADALVRLTATLDLAQTHCDASELRAALCASP
ncbi:MAG: hypothetical protein R3B99_12035 [Polyangiales bacterium]|nr:hypothetical protein [Myxococcales bacterium]